MPEVFTAFTTSAKIWNMYCIREDAPYLPENIAKIEQIKWPDDFEKHIQDKTIELKSKLNGLYFKYKIN